MPDVDFIFGVAISDILIGLIGIVLSIGEHQIDLWRTQDIVGIEQR